MNTKLLLFIVLLTSIAACKKDQAIAPTDPVVSDTTRIDTTTNNNNNNNNNNPLVGYDSSAKKVKIFDNFSADSSEFSYDNNKLLIREHYRGNMYGSQQIITDIFRNSRGMITGYTRKHYNASGQLAKTETATVQSDPITLKYISKLVEKTAGFNTIRDSVIYTYSGAYPYRQLQYSMVDASTPYDSCVAITYAPASDGSVPRVKRAECSIWLFGSSWGASLFYLDFELTTNPLYMPEVGLVVGFNINIAEHWTMNWDDAAFTKYNRAHVHEGFYWVTVSYTHLNNRPLTRTVTNISTVMNSVVFSY